MKVSVQGDKELIKAIEAVGKTKAKKAIRKASRASAKVHQAEAKAIAPRQSGQLVQAIKVRAIPRSRKWIGTTVTMKINYGSFVELGTKKQPAQKFLRVAFDNVKAEAFDKFVQAMNEELRKP